MKVVARWRGTDPGTIEHTEFRADLEPAEKP
jgi:hypothetical protein